MASQFPMQGGNFLLFTWETSIYINFGATIYFFLFIVFNIYLFHVFLTSYGIWN